MKKTAKRYFTEDFNKFFRELAANNHKDWFDENRKRYESNIKKPFSEFLNDLVPVLRDRDENLTTPPNKAAFRINRDIRFSKDKTPYKTHMAAAVSHGDRKNSAYAGLYVQLGPAGVMLAGGSYQPSTSQVQLMREAIVENPVEFRAAIEDRDFVNHFGQVVGEKNKVVPKEFKEAAEKEPLLYNKSWFYHATLEEDLVHSPELMDTILEYFDSSEPVRKFINSALHKG